MIITVCNFSVLETGLSSTGDRLLYAFPMEVPHGYLDRKKSRRSGGADLFDLINEELPDLMSFYSGKVRDRKSLWKDS